jgi:hypothetical protein
MKNIEDILNSDCLNVFLTDENLCLNNSYQIFNTNWFNLSSSLKTLENDAIWFSNLYKIFDENKLKWQNAYTNVLELSSSWNSAYSTVESLSSKWANEIEIIYPNFVDFSDWYLNLSNYKNVTIKNWLDNNFPSKFYSDSVTFRISINLQRTQNFEFKFERNYQEECFASSTTLIRCSRCRLPKKKCNYTESGKKKSNNVPSCNFCNLCDIRGSSAQRRVTCGRLSGNTVLNINYTKNLSDVFLGRIEKIEYKKNINGWYSL